MSLKVWPESLIPHYAISIEVPDEICIGKILGRRYCTKCEKAFNLCDVDGDHINLLYEYEDSNVSNITLESEMKSESICGEFRMEPMLPNVECACNKKETWISRNDDKIDILKKRLSDFHSQTRPVLDYYENIGKLIKFIPFQGVDELPNLLALIDANMKHPL